MAHNRFYQSSRPSSVFKFLIVFATPLCLTPLLELADGPRKAIVGPRAGEIEPKAVAYFIDVAEKAGLNMVNVFGGREKKRFIVETTGTGVAAFDYDNDGWIDLFFVNGTTLEGSSASNHLYRNTKDGKFKDVTEQAGLSSSGWGQGVCVGDYDNDGWPDLYVTYYGKNRLYHNNGNGTFTNVTDSAGVGGNGKAWGTGCAFLDYDRDGKLDLMVANYVDFDDAKAYEPGQGPNCFWKGVPVMCGPQGLKPARNILYHNEGGGRFRDVSEQAKIHDTSGHYAFSVSTLDFNNDGWTDIFIACDSTASILYRNNRDGTFTDVAITAGAAFNEDGRAQAGMGSAVADYNGDGHLDIFKTNFSDDTSTLYRNLGNGNFTDATFEAGLGLNTKYLGWGTVFFDMDNDTWPDLLLVNGHVYPEVDTHGLGSTFHEPRLLYRNNGNGSLSDISKTSGPGITARLSGRGLAVADFWNDGRISAAISNMNDRPSLLVNQIKNPNRWVGIKTIGVKSNRDGNGVRVTVKVGKRSLVDEVRSGSSYISQSDPRLHFGLEKADKIESLEIRWPSGLIETYSDIPINKITTLKEGGGRLISRPGDIVPLR